MGVQQERRPARAKLDVAGGISSSTEQIEYTPAVQSFREVPPLREGGLTVQTRLCYTMVLVMIDTSLEPLTGDPWAASFLQGYGVTPLMSGASCFLKLRKILNIASSQCGRICFHSS
jgi:hypothetical protein